MKEQGKKKATNEKKQHQPNYKEYLVSVDEIKDYLMDHYLLRRNMVKGWVEYRKPATRSGETTAWQPLTDQTENDIWMAMSQSKRVDKKHISNVINSSFVGDYHPFRSYLEHLPPWNGEEDHLLALAMTVQVKGGADEQLRFARYLKKWMVGMVAGWIDPKVVNNVILVLIGAQGSYKTTWFSYLLPPELEEYFRIKTNASRMTKDDLLSLTNYGLLCFEELDTMSTREQNELKSAVTMPSVDERVPYDRYAKHRPHIASFCGTGNNVEFLCDPTGNRRWLPFEVDSILSPRSDPFDYENIYAQAYALYRQGFQYWFSQSDIQQLAQHNQQFETPRLEVELVQQYFRRPKEREPAEFMPVSLALQMVGTGITQKLSTVMIGRAFAELGFERKTSRNVRGYIVVRRSAEEMRSLRSLMAVDNGHTDTDDTDVF